MVGTVIVGSALPQPPVVGPNEPLDTVTVPAATFTEEADDVDPE
jgi:hypothetical protein